MTEPNIQDGHEAKGQLDFITSASLPIELKSIEVLPDGRIRCNAPDSMAVSFEYYGLQFFGTVERGQSPALLTLGCDLGPLPFTSQGSGVRESIQMVMAAANKLVGGRYVLSPEQRMTMSGQVEVDRPITAASLLIAATQFLASEKPVLDVLAKLLTSAEQDQAATSSEQDEAATAA